MVYITGDIHGEVRRVSEMIEKYEITPEDIIVILGDVGMNYYGNKKGDRHRKKKMNNLGVPIFCIHGNHEQRPWNIPGYEIEFWKGGKVWVQKEYPNLKFAKDGEIFLNEINSVPGSLAFYLFSDTIKEWSSLLTSLIEDAIMRHAKESTITKKFHSGILTITGGKGSKRLKK